MVGLRFLLDSGLHVADAVTEAPLAAARDVDDAEAPVDALAVESPLQSRDHDTDINIPSAAGSLAKLHLLSLLRLARSNRPFPRSCFFIALVGSSSSCRYDSDAGGPP